MHVLNMWSTLWQCIFGFAAFPLLSALELWSTPSLDVMQRAATDGGKCLFWQRTAVDGSHAAFAGVTSGCAFALPLTVVHGVVVLLHALGLSLLLARADHREGRRHALAAMSLALPLAYAAACAYSVLLAFTATRPGGVLSQMGATGAVAPLSGVATIGAAAVVLGTLCYRSTDAPEPSVINSVDAGAAAV
jgi:hypothetical protein